MVCFKLIFIAFYPLFYLVCYFYKQEFLLLFLLLDVSLFSFLIYELIKKSYYFYFDFLFATFFSLYFKISYYIYITSGLKVFNFHQDTFFDVHIFCNVTLSLVLIIFYIRPKFFVVHDLKNLLFSNSFNKDNLFIPFVLSLFVSLYFVSNLISVDINSDNLSRVELSNLIGYSGWFLKYFIIAYFYCLFSSIFNKNFKSLNHIIIYLSPVFLYFYFQIQLGGRREILTMLLIFLAFYLIHIDFKINKYFVFNSSIILVFLFLVGVFRDYNGGSVELIFNLFGEFLFPISTLQYYYQNINDVNLGATYFISFTNFIPRSIFEFKPLPLAVDFAHMVSNGGSSVMGYAITPLTEAYNNFGFLSFFIFPILLSFFTMFNEILSKKLSFLPVLLFAFSINFQRSDFSSLFFEVFMIISCIFVIVFLKRFKY